MTPETLDRMMRMIVPLRLNVAEVSGTWKLSQNKPEPARRAVCDSIEQGSGSDLSGLAKAIRHSLE